MSKSSRDSSLYHSDEDDIICSVGFTTKGRRYIILYDFLRNCQDRMLQKNQDNGEVCNAVTIFLGYVKSRK